MFEIIEKLRQKSDRQKSLIAFTVAFLISGIIFVIWFSVIYPNSEIESENLANLENLEQSPFENFSKIFSNGVSEIKNSANDIKNLYTSLNEVTHYINKEKEETSQISP